ncbi:hypothetical protein [Variovorax paradoxus]|nr:hypothetical protein [Variovorax paradoxus]
MTVALILRCPDCEADMEIDADELEEQLEGGGIACCPECGSDRLVVEGE